MTFATSISIHAAPETIWRILTDAPAYPGWNTTVTSVEGRIAAGETVTVRAKISPGRAFPLKVTAFDAPRRMVWSGGMPLGLFTGTRIFELRPPADGAVEFTMAEKLQRLDGTAHHEVDPRFAARV